MCGSSLLSLDVLLGTLVSSRVVELSSTIGAQQIWSVSSSVFVLLHSAVGLHVRFRLRRMLFSANGARALVVDGVVTFSMEALELGVTAGPVSLPIFSAPDVLPAHDLHPLALSGCVCIGPRPSCRFPPHNCRSWFRLV